MKAAGFPFAHAAASFAGSGGAVPAVGARVWLQLCDGQQSGFLPAATGYDRDSGFDGSDPTGGSFHRGGGTSGGISGGGTLAENERFFDVCGRHPSDGIRDPKAESEVVSGAGGSRPGASFIFDLPYVMPCEGGQIYPSGASGGELGAAFTGWRDCWRGCDFTSDDFYLFWLYAGAAVVSGRISAKQGAAAR